MCALGEFWPLSAGRVGQIGAIGATRGQPSDGCAIGGRTNGREKCHGWPPSPASRHRHGFDSDRLKMGKKFKCASQIFGKFWQNVAAHLVGIGHGNARLFPYLSADQIKLQFPKFMARFVITTEGAKRNLTTWHQFFETFCLEK